MGVGEIGCDEIEGGIARTDYGNGTAYDLGAIEVRKVIPGAERFKCGDDVWEQGGPGGLEVDEQSKRLLRFRVENTVVAVSTIWKKVRGGVLSFQDCDKWIYVEACEGSVGSEAGK